MIYFLILNAIRYENSIKQTIKNVLNYWIFIIIVYDQQYTI